MKKEDLDSIRFIDEDVEEIETKTRYALDKREE